MMKGRYTADVSLLDDEIVMFLIGMRIDKAPQSRLAVAGVHRARTSRLGEANTRPRPESQSPMKTGPNCQPI